jgi:uncharacterized membrane protein
LSKPQLTVAEKKQIIVEIIASEKPETINKLMELIRQEYPSSDEDNNSLLMQLAQEGKLRFDNLQNTRTLTSKVFLFSSRATWYWTTLSIAIATVIVVSLIPANAYPLSYLRIAIGAFFLLSLPGFAVTKVLFPSKTSEGLDIVEVSAISVALSLAIIPIIGLIMNYTPWGIKLLPITLGLVGFTGIFATLAMLREYKTVATNTYKKTEIVRITIK